MRKRTSRSRGSIRQHAWWHRAGGGQAAALLAVVATGLLAACGQEEAAPIPSPTPEARAPVTVISAPAPTVEGPAAVTHTVQSGDTLSAIAAAFETTVEELVRINQLENPDILEIGQVLVISE